MKRAINCLSLSERQVILLGFLAIFLTFLFAFCLGFPSAGSLGLFANWEHWDALHYLEIAKDSYQNFGEERFNIAFFPLYPFFIFLLHFLFRDYLFSALFVSNLCFLLSLYFLYKLLEKDFDKKTAWRAVVFLVAFPTAYFLHAPYTESLFLALSLASFYFLRRRCWFLAALLGMFAGLCRLTGFLLIPIFFIEYLDARQFHFRKIKKDILWGIMMFLAPAIYLFLNFKIFGNPLYFLFVQRNHWYKDLNWPWLGFWQALASFSYRPTLEYLMVGVFETLFALILLLTIFGGLCKLPRSYLVYLILNLLLVTSSSFWLSIPRYVLVAFPMFVVLALWAKRRLVFFSLLFLSLSMQFFFLNFFLRGYWAF